MSDEISTETGKSMCDSTENIDAAWALLHRFQQFRLLIIVVASGTRL